MSKKHAEVKPSLNEWVAHIHGSSKPLAVAASRMLRDQYGGYTFTGPDGIIADFPPGTVSYVTRKPPAPRVPLSPILPVPVGPPPAPPTEQRAADVAQEMGIDPAAPMTPGQHAEFARRFEPADPA